MLRISMQYALVMAAVLVVVGIAGYSMNTQALRADTTITLTVFVALTAGVWVGLGLQRRPQANVVMIEPTRDVADFGHSATASTRHSDDLSTRERQVLCLVASGLTNAQIAEKLFVSPNTIKTHVASIYTKLGISNRAQATSYAVQYGHSELKFSKQGR